MAGRVTRAAQKQSASPPKSTPAESSLAPPKSIRKQTSKKTTQTTPLAPRTPSPKPEAEIPPPSSPDPITITSSALQAPSLASQTTNTTTTISIVPTTPNLPLTNHEHTLHSTRRTALRSLQATRYPHLAGTTEPDLNDSEEVRHFEVDSQGSLTFMLLEGGEAWRLREVGMDSSEKGQVIVGRFYVVERV